MNKKRLHAYFYLLITVFIWGAAASVIKFTLEGIDPFPFLAYRFLISGGIAALIILFTQGSNLGLRHKAVKQNLHWIILYGLFATTFALTAVFMGLDHSTVLDLTLIAIAGPLLVQIGGAKIFGDHITHREKIGTLIVLAGVIVAQLLPILGLNGGETSISGNLYLIAFLIFDSAAVLIGKHLSRKKVPEQITTNYAFILAALTLIPIAFFLSGGNLISQMINISLPYHAGVWYMAIASGLVAYFFWLKGQKTIEISEASLFYYLQPVIGVPLAVLWLGEKITPHFVVGAVIIVVGLMIAESKKR